MAGAVGEPRIYYSAELSIVTKEFARSRSNLEAIVERHHGYTSDEITQQRSELEARLVNAQNEEQRILELLQNRNDKSSDPASLEHQVALLRGEIARMQSERYSSDSRATLANLSLSLREERTPPAETIGAKLRAAAVEGLSDAFESVSAILLLLEGRGRLLPLWALLLYFPARLFWRRRSWWALSAAESAKNS